MRRFKGYMTLEASLIIPMVLCVFALLIYFSYYLYGRCILSQDAYVLAFRASVENSSQWKDDPAGYVAQKAARQAGSKYFGSSFPSFDTSIQGKEIRVKGRSRARHAAMGRYFLKPKGSWDYEAEGKAKRRNYSGHIRMATRLKDLGKEILNLGE